MDDVMIRDLQVNLRALHRALRASFPPIEGVSRSAVRVLGVVARTGGAQPGEISDELGMVSSNVAAALRELDDAQYIERSRSATDGRRSVVSLTDRGAETVAAHRLIRVTDLRDTIDSALTATEQDQLAAAIPLLGKLVTAHTPGQRS